MVVDMSYLYYSVIEAGIVPMNIALGIPAFLTGAGLFIESYLREE